MDFKPLTLLLFSLLLIQSYTYSSSMASQMALLSAIAYEPRSQIQSWSCDLCSSIKIQNVQVVEYSKDSVFGFLGYIPSQDSIVISWRGSVDLSNWIINLSAVRVDSNLCDGCSVHTGFNSGFNNVKQDLQNQLESLRSIYRNAKVIVTGHSLGGALAVVCAAHLQKYFQIVSNLYTFGQPRVGNDKYAAFMTQFIPNTFRIINYGDQVPHLPQSILGYKHNGYQIWYQKGMDSYTLCPSQSKSCSNQLGILKLNTGDHSIVLYMQLKVQSLLGSIKGKIWFNMLKKNWLKKSQEIDRKWMELEDKKVKEAIQELKKQKEVISQQ